MKKTILFAILLSSSAFAADTVVFGANDTANPWSFGEYATHVNGTATNVATIATGSFSGIDWTLSMSGGRTWCDPLTDNWTNTAALAQFNAESGYNLTAEQATAGTFSATHAGNGAKNTFTLNFSSSNYSAGDSVIIYAFISGSNDQQTSPLTRYNVSGMDSIQMSVASCSGNGFTEISANTNGQSGFSGLMELSIVRIEGTLTDALSVALNSGTPKTGFAAVTVISPAVPEPATATLGLLALVGLASRRRRK